MIGDLIGTARLRLGTAYFLPDRFAWASSSCTVSVPSRHPGRARHRRASPASDPEQACTCLSMPEFIAKGMLRNLAGAATLRESLQLTEPVTSHEWHES